MFPHNSYIELDPCHKFYGWLFIVAKNGNLVSLCRLSDEVLKICHENQGENSMNEPIKYFDEIREFTPKELEALKKYQPAKKQHFVSTKLSSESLLKDIEAVNLEEQIKKCQTPNNY